MEEELNKILNELCRLSRYVNTHSSAGLMLAGAELMAESVVGAQYMFEHTMSEGKIINVYCRKLAHKEPYILKLVMQ